MCTHRHSPLSTNHQATPHQSFAPVYKLREPLFLAGFSLGEHLIISLKKMEKGKRAKGEKAAIQSAT